MPTTVVSLLIFIFALLPGVPADSIYSRFAGSDWREKDWERIAGILIFSVLGFVIYALLSPVLKLPLPTYIYPTTFSPENLPSASLPNISIAFIGHCISSALLAGLLGLGGRKLAEYFPSAIYPSSWDVFIRTLVPSHWVIVTLTDDRAYAGMLSCVESSVGTAERDIVLEEPAELASSTNTFISLPYQSMFFPASLVSTIAVIHDPDIDTRISEVAGEL